MRTKRYFLAILLTVLLVPAVSAQFYRTGSDPASVRWMELQGPHYRVVYPRGTDSLARRTLMLLENVRPAVLDPLQIDPKPVPVVLHPFNTYSNGVAVWAPSRLELYTTPPAYSGYGEDWLTQLALHESRHVGQMAHYERGIWKWLGYAFGEQIVGLGLAVYVPGWFLEGDAVTAETALSISGTGRGRDASFLTYLRCAYLNGDYRNWLRYLHGSYRHYTPNEYVMGYIQSTFMIHTAGNYRESGDFLRTMVDRWYDPRMIFRDNEALLRFSQWWLTDYWEQDLAARHPLTGPALLPGPSQRLYTDYSSPVPGTGRFKGKVLALKEGMEQSPVLVSLDRCGRERILRPFSGYTSLLRTDGCSLWWSETVPDPRWEQRNWSDLYRMDLQTGKVRRLTRRQRLFNPCPAPDGSVAATEYPAGESSRLVLLDADGQILRRIAAPEGGQIRETVRLGDAWYATVIQSGGFGLYRLRDSSWHCLIAPQSESLTGLRSDGRRIWYTSDLNGVLNIYTYEPETGLNLRHTQSRYGASDPYPGPDGLLYREFTPGGYRPALLPADSLQQFPASLTEPYRHPLAGELTRMAGENHVPFATDTSYLDPGRYPARKYRKAARLFRFHSWAPVYYNVDRILSQSFEKYYDVAALGATVYSQNDLGTAVTMLGYSYHNGFHAGHAKFTWYGWYPVLEAAVDVNDRNRTDHCIEPDPESAVPSLRYRQSEQIGNPSVQTTVRAYIPFNFSSGGWIRGLIPQISWHFSNDRFYAYGQDGPRYRQQLNGNLRYYQVLSTPASSLFPRWGFGVSLSGGLAPGSGLLFGKTVSATAYAYFPGLTRTQGLKLSGTWQVQTVQDRYFLYGSFVQPPRGYRNVLPAERYWSISADYALPVYLGDSDLFRLIYFKRLQIIPFADYARDSRAGTLHSFGSDLLLDFHLGEFTVPLSAGVRYARTGPGYGCRNYFGFLFNASL